MTFSKESLALTIANFIFALVVLFAYGAFGSNELWGWLYLASLLLMAITIRHGVYGFSLALHFLISYIGLFYVLPVYSYLAFGEFEADRPQLVGVVNAINIAAAHLFLGAYCAHGRPRKLIPVAQIDQRAFEIVSMVYLALFVLATVLIFSSVGGIAVLQISRVALKEGAGAPAYLLWLYYVAAPAIFLVTVLLVKRRASLLKWCLFFVVIVLCSVLIFISLRSRSPAIMNLFTFASAIYAAKYFEFDNTEDVHPRYLPAFGYARFAPLILIIGLGAIFLRFFRGMFFESSSRTFDYRAMIEATLRGGDLGYTLRVMDVIELFETTGIKLSGDSYIRLLWRIVPERILGDRPQDTQVLIGQALTGVDVMTIPPGVAGDAYVNFGLGGLVVFLAYGLIVSIFDRRGSTFVAAAMFCSSLFVMFHFVRGAFSNVLITYVILFISLYLVKSLVVTKRHV